MSVPVGVGAERLGTFDGIGIVVVQAPRQSHEFVGILGKIRAAAVVDHPQPTLDRSPKLIRIEQILISLRIQKARVA